MDFKVTAASYLPQSVKWVFAKNPSFSNITKIVLIALGLLVALYCIKLGLKGRVARPPATDPEKGLNGTDSFEKLPVEEMKDQTDPVIDLNKTISFEELSIAQEEKDQTDPVQEAGSETDLNKTISFEELPVEEMKDQIQKIDFLELVTSSSPVIGQQIIELLGGDEKFKQYEVIFRAPVSSEKEEVFYTTKLGWIACQLRMYKNPLPAIALGTDQRGCPFIRVGHIRISDNYKGYILIYSNYESNQLIWYIDKELFTSENLNSDVKVIRGLFKGTEKEYKFDGKK